MEEHQDSNSGGSAAQVVIHDHELIRLIGRGSYGEVWLARNSLGTYRAVKIVYEKTFRDRRPFEREFKGVQKFEPISRLHDGLVDVLHVGRNDSAGYFYCVMELADDVVTGQNIVPADYLPRSLAYDMAQHKKLSFTQCQHVGAAIASALDFLHRRELIHRDVKPSNIVFVNGVPKLADIGLVAEMADAKSYVGTEGFIPPEGPGTVQADIYSLGKVLYELSTGKDRRDYPDLPTYLGDSLQKGDLIELNRIIWKACRTDPRQRYKSANAMAAHLTALDNSAHTRFLKRVRQLALTSLKVTAIIACLVGAIHWIRQHTSPPTIRVPADFGPVFGPPGTKITVAGTHYSPTLSDNIVHFGPVRAQVLSVTPSNLTAAVPYGATYASIHVATTGYVTCAHTPFLPTFEGAGTAFGKSNFGPRIDLRTHHGPNFLAIADFDGDGRADLAVAEYYNNTFALYRNISSDGSLTKTSFTEPVTFSFGPGLDIPYRIAAGDVDGDGKIDLLIPNRQSSLMIYRNISTVGALTTNSFAAPVVFATALDVRTIAVHDLDGDGRADIVGAANGSSMISILQNVGAAGGIDENSFAIMLNFAADSNPTDLAVADLDGDGKPDIAAINTGGTTISLYRNISTPGKLTLRSFAPRVDLPAPYNCTCLAAGDLDGDGRIDLVAGSHDAEHIRRLITIWRNVSTPGSLSPSSFDRGVDFPVLGWPNNVTVGDVSGDGKPEVLVVMQLPSHLQVFENLSTPGIFGVNSLAPPINFATKSNATGVVVADLSNDGRPEIIFGNAYSQTVSIYQNLTPFKPAALSRE